MGIASVPHGGLLGRHHPMACPGRCSVLEDFINGWEGWCYGLTQYPTETQEECQANCCTDATCVVWQFAYTGCWSGKGHYCRNGYSHGFQKRPESLKLMAAQRIVHGTIEVLEDLAGQQCIGLKRDVFFSNISHEVLVQRCRLKCY